MPKPINLARPQPSTVLMDTTVQDVNTASPINNTALSKEHRLNVAPSLQSRFKEHVRQWRGTELRSLPSMHNRPPGEQQRACTKCNLCKTRRNVCIYRGNIPCDVLFIGEAPGESEDALGYPFVGPAGKELDALWLAAYMEHSLTPKISGLLPVELTTYGTTNILGCIPRTEGLTGDLRPPKRDEADACQPRLLEVLTLADPRAIVLLGDSAKRFFPKILPNLKRWNGKAFCLIHPSHILREEIPARQSLLRKRFILSLTNVLKEL